MSKRIFLIFNLLCARTIQGHRSDPKLLPAQYSNPEEFAPSLLSVLLLQTLHVLHHLSPWHIHQHRLEKSECLYQAKDFQAQECVISHQQHLLLLFPP
ncbi:hypothetical protein B566_EDAN003772 [Ephemera danica]|nr:hypothetical protein B566_EDAN003772 [Ephemera danica]